MTIKKKIPFTFLYKNVMEAHLSKISFGKLGNGPFFYFTG